MDCGNNFAVLQTSKEVLDLEEAAGRIPEPENLKLTESLVVQPSYIGKNVHIIGSRVGPYVSIGDNTTICCCVISSSIVGSESRIDNAVLNNSIIGNYSHLGWETKVLSVGDYSRITE
jgi:glucose-1-phosphate thymidylyltransferase